MSLAQCPRKWAPSHHRLEGKCHGDEQQGHMLQQHMPPMLPYSLRCFFFLVGRLALIYLWATFFLFLKWNLSLLSLMWCNFILSFMCRFCERYQSGRDLLGEHASVYDFLSERLDCDRSEVEQAFQSNIIMQRVHISKFNRILDLLFSEGISASEIRWEGRLVWRFGNMEIGERALAWTENIFI